MSDMALDRLRFRLSEATSILDMNNNTLRAWITRHGLFPEFRDLGTGNPIEFGVHHLMQVAAAKALNEARLSAASASDIVAQSGAWPFHIGSQWLRAQPNHEGRWQQVVYDPRGEITITVNLAAIWDDLAPRIREHVDGKAAAHLMSQDDAARLRTELDLATALAWDDDDALRRIAGDDTIPAVREKALDGAAEISRARAEREREHFQAKLAGLREQYGFAGGLRETMLEYHRAHLIAHMATDTTVKEAVRDEVAAAPYGDEALAWLDDVQAAAREAGRDG